MSNPATLLLIYLAFTLTYSANKGFYTPAVVISMILILMVMLILSWPRVSRFDILRVDLDQLLKVSLFVMALLALTNYGGFSVTATNFFWAGIFCHSIILMTAFLFFIKVGSDGTLARLARWQIPVYLTAIITAKLMMIFASPSPNIDVFHLVTKAGLNVINGIDPYGFTYHLDRFPGDIFEHFNYLPLSFLLPLPFKLILGDIRYAFLACDLISAFGLYLLAARAFAGSDRQSACMFIPLLFLTNPIHGFLLENAWVEPIMVLLLVVFALSFQRNEYRPSNMTAVLIGLLLATKQYIFIIIPLLLKLKGWGLRHFAIAAVTSSLVILPFYIWSPADFINDLLKYYVQYQPRYDAATVISLMHNDLTTIEAWLQNAIDNIYLAYFIVLLPASLAFIIIFAGQQNTLNGFFAAMATLLMAFFLFSKMSFANYDYLIGSVLLLAMAAGEPSLNPKKEFD